MSLFISPWEAYLNPVSGFLSPVLEHPLCAFHGISYLILPITCVFVNEKVEFTWLTQDDIPREWFVPGTEPRHQPPFVMADCLGSCGFLNNLFWCLYLWNSIGCQKSTVAKALCLWSHYWTLAGLYILMDNAFPSLSLTSFLSTKTLPKALLPFGPLWKFEEAIRPLLTRVQTRKRHLFARATITKYPKLGA